jgi:hypothetical protein
MDNYFAVQYVLPVIGVIILGVLAIVYIAFFGIIVIKENYKYDSKKGKHVRKENKDDRR